MSPISRSSLASSFRRSTGFSVFSRTAMPHRSRWSSRSTWIRLSFSKGSNGLTQLLVLKVSDGRVIVISTETASNATAPTQYVTVRDNTYAYRRFGAGPGAPLLFLQHFTGTLDNWDPAVTDPLALGRSVILFENAGIGRSSGNVPETVSGMTDHAMKFLNALGLTWVDVLGFSLGGMVAQVMALKRPALLRRIVLTGTGPEGGGGVAMDRPQ